MVYHVGRFFRGTTCVAIGARGHEFGGFLSDLFQAEIAIVE
jgi:hypothetical protein